MSKLKTDTKVQNVIRLLVRKNGADLNEIKKTGLNYSAVTTLKMVERRGFKTFKKKLAEGELTRYFAKKKPGTSASKRA